MTPDPTHDIQKALRIFPATSLLVTLRDIPDDGLFQIAPNQIKQMITDPELNALAVSELTQIQHGRLAKEKQPKPAETEKKERPEAWM
jgi:hypothetical protein